MYAAVEIDAMAKAIPGGGGGWLTGAAEGVTVGGGGWLTGAAEGTDDAPGPDPPPGAVPTPPVVGLELGTALGALEGTAEGG